MSHRFSHPTPKSDDVGTTPRKRLTPRERLALFERKRGICSICGLKIRGSFIDEHWRALGLGGSNDPSNRDIAHPKCAAVKALTRDDRYSIVEVKDMIVTKWTALSTSHRSMSGKTFSELVDKVLALGSDMIEVAPEELRRHTERDAHV